MSKKALAKAQSDLWCNKNFRGKPKEKRVGRKRMLPSQLLFWMMAQGYLLKLSINYLPDSFLFQDQILELEGTGLG